MYQTIGLPNIGNSCYFNAFIQVVKPLMYEILSKEQLQEIPTPLNASDSIKQNTATTNELVVATNNFFTKYFNDPAKDIREEYKQIYIIINNIRKFQFGSQQDSSEALFLITDLVKNYQHLKSLVTVGFNQVIECNKCGCYKICDIQEEAMLISNTLQTTNDSAISFKQFLGNMLIKCEFEPTTSNEFKCKCNNEHKNSLNIKIVLTKMPKYLFVNVGRYDNNRRKITKLLEIALNFKITTPLNLNDILAKQNNDKIEHTYDLIGIAVHHGNTLNGGHYTAYCKVNDQWYYCNDGHVSSCDINKSIQEASGNCTLLVYKSV